MYSYDRTEARTAKRAALQDGPVGRVLERHWNLIHDLEHFLEKAAQDYDDAAHFMGGPAEREAKEMLRKIQTCVKELEHLSHKSFADLVDAEAAFVKKFGEPGAYADTQRAQVFPR